MGPQLAMAFSRDPTVQKDVPIVFVSSDRDEASFREYYSAMPWFAVSYENPMRQMLGSVYCVRGIPALVIVDAATGRQISTNGRQDLAQNGFDLSSCLRVWGFTQSTAPSAALPPASISTSMSASAPEPATSSQPAAQSAPKVKGPAPIELDNAISKEALQRVAGEPYEVQEPFFKTALKIIENVLRSPDEPKFRQLKKTNAALKTKLFDVGGDAASTLFELAGFELCSSGEVLQLPGAPDGRCTALRDLLQNAATAAWETNARAERDKKIQQEQDKDKADRSTRYSGSGDGNGRMNLGRRGPQRGGG